MDRIQMPPTDEPWKSDETAALGLRLMRSFLKLREARHREEVIALAERLASQQQASPAQPRD
jgi:hypothetical protein